MRYTSDQHKAVGDHSGMKQQKQAAAAGPVELIPPIQQKRGGKPYVPKPVAPPGQKKMAGPRVNLKRK